MKPWVIRIVALLVILAAGFGIGWVVNDWLDKDSTYTPRLTGAEAAVILQADYNLAEEEITAAKRRVGYAALLYQLELCEPVDFNEVSRAWIIRCTHFAVNIDRQERQGDNLRFYRVFDATGSWEPVSSFEEPEG